MDKRKTLRFALLALAISLLVELLFFNLKPLSSLGSGSWTPLPEPIITGDFASDLVVTLQYTGLDQEIPWCHFAVGVCDKDGNTVRTQLVIQYSDEGNANAYKAGTVNYTLAHDHASYFRLNSYGKIHDLSVRIEALSSGCSYWVAAAEINGSVPFHISAGSLLFCCCSGFCSPPLRCMTTASGTGSAGSRASLCCCLWRATPLSASS